MKRLFSSRAFHIFLGTSVSVLLLVWVFSEINFERISDQARRAHYWYLVPAGLLFVLHFILRAVRWHFLLPNGERANLRQRFDGIMVGNLANYLLPLRAGEFIRPYMLARTTKVSFAEGFASVVTERFFDLTAVLLTFALILPSLPMVPRAFSTGAWVLGGVSLVILVFIFLAILTPQLFEWIFEFIFRHSEAPFVQKLRRFRDDFTESARVLSKPWNLFAVLFLTALVWISCYIMHYAFLLVIPVEGTFMLAVGVSVLVALAVAAPSAPGFIGVYQGACLVGFELYGYEADPAVLFSVITHCFHYAAFIIYGMYALSKAGLRFGELRRRSEVALDPEAEQPGRVIS